MPAPDPHAIERGESKPGRICVTFRPCYLGQGKTHRKARAISILRNLHAGDWTCPQCREPVPLYRRADAGSVRPDSARLGGPIRVVNDGADLRALHKAAGLSQTQLARLAG